MSKSGPDYSLFRSRMPATLIGNESVPKIIINNTISLFLKTAISILLISNHNSFRVLSGKIASVYFICMKYIYILALEIASWGNQHCANCIGTLSFPIGLTWLHVGSKEVVQKLGHSRKQSCELSESRIFIAWSNSANKQKTVSSTPTAWTSLTFAQNLKQQYKQVATVMIATKRTVAAFSPCCVLLW